MEKDILKIKLDAAIKDFTNFALNHPFVKELKAMPPGEQFEILISIFKLKDEEITQGLKAGMKLLNSIDIQLRKN